MTRTLTTLLIVTALCCAHVFSTRTFAQTATPQGTSSEAAQAAGRPEFRFVSTNKVWTIEAELNALAAQGFRLERVSKSTLGDDLAALVTRDPAAADARYEYKLIATRRVATMEKELVEAAEQGYELRGLAALFRPVIGVYIGDETVAVVERPAGATTRRYEYKLLSTRREKTMQQELNEAVSAGYTPLEMVHGQDNGAASILLGPKFVNTIILGRRPDNSEASADAREYKFLTTTKVGTMEREMNQAAKEGYRFYMSAPNLLMLMHRERGGRARPATSTSCWRR